MSVLYSKPLRQYKKRTFKTGDRVRFSNYDLLFRKGYKPQFTREEIVAIETKNHQHRQSRMSRMRKFKANFIKKSLLKSFNNGFV